MTKVELTFNLPKSKILDIDEKILAKERLKTKLSLAGNIRIAVETSRSQLKNKNLSIERFYDMIEKALKKPKYRKPTEPTKSSIEKRYTEKHVIAEKKKSRKNIDLRSIEND